MLEEVVPEALAGERVDRLVAFATGCSRGAAAALIERGGVRRNQRLVRKGSERLAAGDRLDIDTDLLPRAAPPAADPGVPFEVVFEDDQVIVVDKPAGVVVHPGAGSPEGTLVNGLLARYPELAGIGETERPGIVHRLDKGTSGLLVVARSEAARNDLSRQLAARLVDRVYLAVVWGHLASDHGLVDAPVGRDQRNPTRMAVVADGRAARTGYDVVRRADEPGAVTVLQCRLETGRTHQIRVHLASIGHPVVGDPVYGGVRAPIRFDRPALHAAQLGFTHPRSGDWLAFEAPAPADLQGLLDELR